MKRNRRAKIVATIGPASSTRQTIKALFEAGVDVFRLNFSHGTHEEHEQRIEYIRQLEPEYGRPTTVLMDLQGPKLRIGTFEAAVGVELVPGQTFILDLADAVGSAFRVSLPHPEIFQARMAAGSELLLDDGRIRLEVMEAHAERIVTRVADGGRLTGRKGVNVPHVVLPLSPLTAKDRLDLDFGLRLGVDWMALSFVQCAADIRELRRLVGDRAWVVAKIEKPLALACVAEIVAEADGIMVARGDLGVELPPERVPVAQRTILREARRRGRPVIVATQMLESMVHMPVPTRAEASDVATAIYEGADAVMLSAESASGRYPLQAVRMMDKIIQEVEADCDYLEAMNRPAARDGEPSAPSALCLSLKTVVEVLKVPCTVTYTDSGATCLRAARERLQSMILSVTPRLETARRLGLVWGVHSVTSGNVQDVVEMSAKACSIAAAEGFASKGDLVPILAGLPFGGPGTTNLLRIATVT
jgi:pyruvate kinase